MSDKSRIAIIATVIGTIIALLTFLFGSGILKKTVIDIALESSPNKTSYTIGETLDTSGIKLIVYYENGSTEIVDRGFSCTPTTLNNAGSQEITISFKGKTTAFPVSVSAVPTTPTTPTTTTTTTTPTTTTTTTTPTTTTPTTTTTTSNVSISSIAVEANPDKLSYYVGETLNTSGLKLKVTYSDGKTKTISNDYSCSPTTLGSAGSQVVTVRYGGVTTSFSVTVNTVSTSSISIESSPDKTSYYVGDTINTSGMKINVLYSNGTKETITSGFSYYPTELSNPGTQTITVSYDNKSTTLSVFVSSPTVTLSTYSESISKNCWDDSYWDRERGEPFWELSLPTASTTPGGPVSWSIIAGSAYIREGFIAAQQPGTIVARATYNYCGYSYFEDYTVEFSMYKVTTDINYLYNAPSKNSSVLINVPNNTRVAITNVAWDASVQASEGRYYLFGNTTYNGNKGWIVIS